MRVRAGGVGSGFLRVGVRADEHDRRTRWVEVVEGGEVVRGKTVAWGSGFGWG